MSSSLLLAVGAPTWDTILKVPAIPPAPAKVLAEACVEIAGGTASNGARAIARLGGKVEYWGRVGEDETGKRIVASLAAGGLDVQHVRRVSGGRSTLSTILVQHDGERLVVPYYDGALDPTPDWLPVTTLGRFTAALIDTRWPAGAAHVLDAARQRQLLTVLDADTTPAEILADLAPRASHVVFAQPALIAFAGTEDIDVGLTAMAGKLPGFVGVTVGAEGFRWIEKGRVRHIPAPRVKVVDTLGAGDTFHGGFTLGLAEGMGVEQAARFASAAAAIKCTRFGGMDGAPTRREVENLLRGA